MRRERRTRILATLGPSSDTKDIIRELVMSGADAFRLNASHGTHEDMRARYHMIREVEEELKHPIGVLLDLQGPKLRIGQMYDDVVLKQGDIFTLDLDENKPGDAARAPMPHPEIFTALVPGARVLINDGKIRLEVINSYSNKAEMRVMVGGPLTSRKGVNVPDVDLSLSAMTDKDRKDLDFALELGVDWIALSFVQRPEDVLSVKNIVDGRALIMAKIEKPNALKHIREIFDVSDGIMVARGDLGVELPLEEVPSVQREIVYHGRHTGKPVVVATQMLESMIGNPMPTRAEVSDVATAVYEGTDAIMLSAESAAGKYPIEAVRVMSRVAKKTENTAVYLSDLDAMRCPPEHTSSDAITAAARQVAETIGASAIVTYTTSGSTAMRLSRERTLVPVIAMTPVLAVARRMALVWGLNVKVTPIVTKFTETVKASTEQVKAIGLGGDGERIVITAGVPFGRKGTTNTLRIAVIGEDITDA
ncbi:MAG: pyruvate kinase [Pseudomonadota bacterium]